MKKIVSLLLCLAMLMTMVIPVFADDGIDQLSNDTPDSNPTVPSVTPPAPTVCTHSWEVVSSTNATCTTNGVKDSKCGKCGATMTETIPATGHSMGSWVHVDSNTHKRSCACGHEETAAHTLTETVTTAATCVSAGVSSFSCACGYSFTKENPATGVHTYTDWSATVETHSRSCTVCQKAESGSHVFTERVDKPATCKEEGVIAEYCSTCEYIVYEVLPKLTTHTYDNACDTDCNVCGLTREIEHKYQQWRTKGVSGHWYACTVCGDKGNYEAHYPGPAATEEKDQICLVCGYVMTPKLNHQHDYAKTWTSNEEGHWYACAGCEEQKDFKAHVYDDACDAECNVCGYKTGNAHTFDGTWHSDEDGHWFVCSVCGNVAESKPHTPPADATEVEAQYCTDCGYMIAPAMAHIHAFSEEWMKDDQFHWQACECGEKSGYEVHAWEEGTGQENGSMTYVCTVCEAEYTEEAAEEPAEEKAGFPWWIVLVVLVVLLIAAVVALILVLKPGKKGRFTA